MRNATLPIALILITASSLCDASDSGSPGQHCNVCVPVILPIIAGDKGGHNLLFRDSGDTR